MKKLFFLTVLCSISAFSQTTNDKKVFLDSLYKETAEGNHKYYRIIKDYGLTKDTYKFETYTKNGVKRIEGTVSDKETLTREGEFLWYYENGNKEILVTYSKSIPIGKEIKWYENGNKKTEAFYTDENVKTGRNFRVDQYWDTKGNHTVIDGNGVYTIDDEYSTFSGNLKNGFKDGVWKCNYLKIDESFTEIYDNGNLVSGVFTDSDKTTHEYFQLEVQPKPIKGMQDFYNYFGQNIKMPKRIKNITGKILIEFVIDKEGKIVEPKIVKSLDPELDQQAIAVLMRYENWIPGQQRGQNIRCRYSLPLNFKPGN